MKNILNKKGFTLAELLIVVAIIAILVAIALPLFFGALDNAREQTFNANLRSLKAAGITAVLKDGPDNVKMGKDAKVGNVYKITGKVSANGNITEVAVERVDSAGDDATTWEKTHEYYSKSGGWTVYAEDVEYTTP